MSVVDENAKKILRKRRRRRRRVIDKMYLEKIIKKNKKIIFK